MNNRDSAIKTLRELDSKISKVVLAHVRPPSSAVASGLLGVLSGSGIPSMNESTWFNVRTVILASEGRSIEKAVWRASALDIGQRVRYRSTPNRLLVPTTDICEAVMEALERMLGTPSRPMSHSA